VHRPLCHATADKREWVTLRNRGEPTAFATLATPILATAVPRRATARDLTRLKSILELRDQAF
jgi:hypothetical protein